MKFVDDDDDDDAGLQYKRDTNIRLNYTIQSHKYQLLN